MRELGGVLLLLHLGFAASAGLDRGPLLELTLAQVAATSGYDERLVRISGYARAEIESVALYESREAADRVDVEHAVWIASLRPGSVIEGCIRPGADEVAACLNGRYVTLEGVLSRDGSALAHYFAGALEDVDSVRVHRLDEGESAAPALDLSGRGRMAYSVLRRAEAFQGIAVGYAGGISIGVLAMQDLLQEPQAVEAFTQLTSEATPEGQLYALCGLRLTDRQRYEALLPAYRADRRNVAVNRAGCIIAAESMGDVVGAAWFPWRWTISGGLCEDWAAAPHPILGAAP